MIRNSSNSKTTKLIIQPDIRNALSDSVEHAYLKLMRTVYEIVLSPAVLYKHLKFQ